MPTQARKFGWDTNAPRGPVSTLVLGLVLYGFFLYLFIEAADYFSKVEPLRRVSMGMFVVDWMFLYVHEGGHFLFSFFGRTLAILGGSFWQVMFPLLSFVLAVRDTPRIAPVPLYFTGYNLMSVSHYMLDAPMRKLHLLGGDKRGHDWHNLFNTWGVMAYSDTIAGITYWPGWVCCVGAIVAGIFFGLQDYWKPNSFQRSNQ